MTKLADLDAQFVSYRPAQPECGLPQALEIVNAGCTADGILFLCPKCHAENGGPVGTHSVLCWFVGRVADDVEPGPGRWTPSGTGISDLSLTPSVHLLAGCGWHGFVGNGDAT